MAYVFAHALPGLIVDQIHTYHKEHELEERQIKKAHELHRELIKTLNNLFSYTSILAYHLSSSWDLDITYHFMRRMVSHSPLYDNVKWNVLNRRELILQSLEEMCLFITSIYNILDFRVVSYIPQSMFFTKSVTNKIMRRIFNGPGPWYLPHTSECKTLFNFYDKDTGALIGHE